ncbi:MAG: 50S ribosomal protein L22 [Opitutales bacterium]|nr:50S ribosomal protein L22 [Opitutales bacterium]MDD4348381.1 50S ribosomal protein L22 [Opitutales bacterium]
MEIRALTKYSRMSPQKVREITRVIQGKNAAEAAELLKFIPRKSARLVYKTLKSAIANAENNANVVAESLTIKSAIVNEGPSIKRFHPVARGMAHPYKKRMSHITIVLAQS